MGPKRAKPRLGFGLIEVSRASWMFLSCGISCVFSLRFPSCYWNRNTSPHTLWCEWQWPRTRTSKYGLLPEESTASCHQHQWSRSSPQHISLHSRTNTRGKCQLDHWVQWPRWELESYLRNFALTSHFPCSHPCSCPPPFWNSLLNFQMSPLLFDVCAFAPSAFEAFHERSLSFPGIWLSSVLPSNLWPEQLQFSWP